MKKFSKKVIALILLVVLLSFSVNAENESYKDETVYGILNSDGNVDNIYVVNRIFESEDNVYVDYGEYMDIINLSTTTVPVIDGDKITFTEDENLKDGLFYQGTIKKQLPYNISIEYYHNDNIVLSNEVAGKSGKFKIVIEVKANENYDIYMIDSMLAQLSITLNLSDFNNISHDGATSVIAGSNKTLNYTIIGNDNAKYTIEFDCDDFYLDPITVSILQSEIQLPHSILSSLDEFDRGLEKFTNGFDELIGGTKQLENGLSELKTGVVALDEGFAEIVKGGEDLSYGLSEMSNGLLAIKEGSNEINGGLGLINENGASLSYAVEQLSSGSQSMLEGHEQLMLLANQLVLSNDPNVRALAQGVIDEYEGMVVLNTSASMLNSGLKEYTDSLNMLALKYKGFHSGLGEIANNSVALSYGLIEYIGGLKLSVNGLSEISVGMNMLPAQVSELNNGQVEMKNGIVLAFDQINSLMSTFTSSKPSVKSFVSDMNEVRSIQFILTTKAIDKVKDETILVDNEEKETFLIEF